MEEGTQSKWILSFVQIQGKKSQGFYLVLNSDLGKKRKLILWKNIIKEGFMSGLSQPTQDFPLNFILPGLSLLHIFLLKGKVWGIIRKDAAFCGINLLPSDIFLCFSSQQQLSRVSSVILTTS